MAAHHDKLYPPATVYQVRNLKNKLWSKRVPDFCLFFFLLHFAVPHRFSLGAASSTIYRSASRSILGGSYFQVSLLLLAVVLASDLALLQLAC